METELKPDEQLLTQQDLDQLCGMMIIFLHSAERIVQMIELAYDEQYRNCRDYQKLVKLYGQPNADTIVKASVRKVIRNDERLNLSRLLKIGQDFHKAMERITNEGMKAHAENGSEIANFNAIEHDTNLLCYIYALMANVPDGDDIKLLSTLKVLAKEQRVSDRILDRLKANSEIV